jgi:aromatic-amino-acid transaminase
MQTVGSSGGLKVGADFIARWFPGSSVWVSDPTWDNHRAMFEGAGITVNTYPYYDPPPAACASTPCATRCGAAGEERRAAARLLPQPDRRGPDARAVGRADPAAGRAAAAALPGPRLPGLRRRHRGGRLRGARPRRRGPDLLRRQLVLQEHERVRRARRRALSVVCPSAPRRSWCSASSRPPCGATTPARRSTAGRSSRGCSATRRCARCGKARSPRCASASRHAPRLHGCCGQAAGRDFGYFLTQRGMFSYTGLSAAQVDRLREEHGVYLVRSGRMCVAGLNSGNVDGRLHRPGRCPGPGRPRPGFLHQPPRQGDWSCASCHGAVPTSPASTPPPARPIDPLAPAQPQRFTDPAKTEKWFRRNCNDVLGRECSAGREGRRAGLADDAQALTPWSPP